MQQHLIESRRRRVGRALRREQDAHRRLRVVGESVGPAQLEQHVVEGVGLGRGDRLVERRREELAVLLVHQRSAPRSRRRRATMLRWISALPP
jgi:hypothetical protein